MKRIGKKLFYVLFLILLVTAMLLMMAGPLYADAYSYNPTVHVLDVTVGIEETFSLMITGTPNTNVTGIHVVGFSHPQAKTDWITTSTVLPLKLDPDGKGTLIISVLTDTAGAGFGAKIKAVGDDGEAEGCNLTINSTYGESGPGISLTKIANPTSITQGISSTITYTYVVTNTGGVDLSGVDVVDSNSAIGTIVVGALASGANTTVTATYTVTPADTSSIVNTAVATGTPPEEQSDVTAVAGATVTVTAPAPGPAVYTITASTEGPGSITDPGSFNISEGAGKIYSMTPGDGASIVDVLVNEVSVGAVSSYTFLDVRSNQTIHAIFSSGVVAVAGITEEEVVEVEAVEEEVVEVLAVEELPYTGFNFIFSLAGILLIMAGGILAATVFLPRKKGEIS